MITMLRDDRIEAKRPDLWEWGEEEITKEEGGRGDCIKLWEGGRR